MSTPEFETALDTAGFIGGPVVREFERDFAKFCEAPFCVGMASGTDALRFALIAVGVRAGDTVVTVPLTFIATTEAISQAGAGRISSTSMSERDWPSSLKWSGRASSRSERPPTRPTMCG